MSPRQRVAFAETLSMLYTHAGNPPLKKVVASAAAIQRQRDPKARSVTVQRISDWRRGKVIPHRFESIEPVLRVLIGEAKRRGSHSMTPGIYDIEQWRIWWKAARTSALAENPDQSSQKDGTPSGSSCPYLGLSSFDTIDSELFFGRERRVDELVALINKVQVTDPGIIVVTGLSGVGKSSLLSAGLIPAMNSGAVHPSTLNSDQGAGSWVSVRMTPGTDPLGNLRRCLEQPHIRDRAAGVRLLVVVDQAEELFTVAVPTHSCAEFVAALHAMSQTSMLEPSAVVIMGLRSDAIGRCAEFPELAEAVKSRCMVLGRMSTEELRDVVLKPAKAAGLRIEPGLVDLILHDVGVEDILVETGRLPLLSHVLRCTWSRRSDGQLTVAGYRAAGGVRRSVAETGESAWNQLDDTQREIAQRMLLRLVIIGEIGYDSCRRQSKQVLLDIFVNAEAAEDVLKMLTAARLLTVHDGDVMFTHEVVLRAWPRLAGWIDEDRVHAPIRQRAQEDAQEWTEHGRDRAFLQSGARLEKTLAWFTQAHDVDRFVEQFVMASVKRSRRVTTVKRIAVAILAVLSIIAESAGVVTIQQHRVIVHQYDRSRLLATQTTPLVTQPSGDTEDIHTAMFSPDARTKTHA